MSAPAVTVLDYGMGNLLSVSRAFEHCGAQVEMTDRPERARRADRLVLPGVGSFTDCIDGLLERGLGEAVKDFVAKGAPFLGICVGMQILLEEGEEYGRTEGLGLIPGKVKAIPRTAADGSPHKIPHVGWTAIRPPEGMGRERWNGTVLERVAPGTAAYFVHSYTAVPDSAADRLADCHYNGRLVSAAIRHANITATQFHPEKSGPVGLSIISRFLQS